MSDITIIRVIPIFVKAKNFIRTSNSIGAVRNSPDDFILLLQNYARDFLYSSTILAEMLPGTTA